MRISRENRENQLELLQAEKRRFAELDKQKHQLWLHGKNVQEYERVKNQWKDSAEEINHLHRKLYPNFLRRGFCPHCGCDLMPVLGSNDKELASQCIACERYIS